MKAIKTFVLASIKDILGEDFKEVKTCFYKSYPDFYQLIDVHISPRGETSSLTIDFGIIIPKIFQLIWSESYKDEDFKKLTVNNGVFKCNMNDLIVDFKGKPRVRYWMLESETLVQEISGLVSDKLVPFMKMFDSLQSIDKLIDDIPFPSKGAIDKPVMRLALKYILGKDDEFYNLATQLKTEKNHFVSMVDKLLLKKTFE